MWRDTMRTPRIFIFEAKTVVLPLMLSLLHIRLWTLILCIAVIVALRLAEARGMSTVAAVKAVRSAIAGSIRPATPISSRRRMIDHG